MRLTKFTLPYEDRSIKPGSTIMVNEPEGKEHYVTNVEYDHRGSKIVTIVELTPYDAFGGAHREDLGL